MKLWLSLIVLLTVLGCTSPESYRADVAKHYVQLGWLKNSAPEAERYSGPKLIHAALVTDRTLYDVFDKYGQPDYVRAVSAKVLLFAYLEKGVILAYRHDYSGSAPWERSYTRVKKLPDFLLKEFRKYHQSHEPECS